MQANEVWNYVAPRRCELIVPQQQSALSADDEKSRRLVGVVTERAVCHGAASDNGRPSEVPVDDIVH